MGSKEKLVCVICCEEFKAKKAKGCGRSKGDTIKILQQFCEEILIGKDKKLELEENAGLVFESSVKGQNRGAGVGSGKGENFEGDDDEVKSEVDEDKEIPIFHTDLEARLSQFLDNPGDNLTVCGKCVEMMNTVTETRLSVKLVEERVEKLQLLLLREMGQLARKMDRIREEFRKIEKTLVSGDLKILEKNLDECYSKNKRGKPKVQGIMNEDYVGRKQEIWGFRGKICDVLNSLEKYCFQIRQKHSAVEKGEDQRLELDEIKIEVDNPNDKGPQSQPNVTDKLNGDLIEEDDFNDQDDMSPMEEKYDDDNSHNQPVKDFHLRKMSAFKRSLVESVLQIQHWHQNKEESPSNSITGETPTLTPFKHHMRQLSYDLESNLIYLSEVPIKILCKAEDPTLEKNGMLCVKCSDFQCFEMTQDMTTIMYDHVLSKHLNAYQCPHCIEKKLETELEYRRHVKSCGSRVKCKVCGKTTTKKSAKKHKLVHMTKEERQEAIDKGIYKRYHYPTKDIPKLFQCEKCGKRFALKCHLVVHEEVHKDRSEREQAMCPKCGKTFLTAGYLKYHYKYSDTCADEPRKEEICDKCGGRFKTKHILKRHVIMMHSERSKERPFVCGKCGKGFKMKKNLVVHETSHLIGKPFKCKACGVGFKASCYLRRHENEKRCKKK